MKEPDLIDYYTRRALEYERIYHKPERQKDLGTLRLLVAEQLADREVLEIACGTGYWTEVIAPAARSVVATDASEAVMDVARHKTYPEGRVRFATADAFDPAAIDGRFTALFAGFFWFFNRGVKIVETFPTRSEREAAADEDALPARTG